MRIFSLIALILILLSPGCQSYSSGVVSVDSDTYKVSVLSKWGAEKAREKAYKDAIRFAEEAEQRMVPVDSSEHQDRDMFGDEFHTYDLIFRLGDLNNPE